MLSWEEKEVMRLRRLAQPRGCNEYSINVPAYAGELEKLTQQDSGLLGGKATAVAFRAGETVLFPQIPGKPQVTRLKSCHEPEVDADGSR